MSEAMTFFTQALEQLRLAALNIPGLTKLATYPFLFRPLVMVVLLGVVAGVIGVIVNLRTRSSWRPPLSPSPRPWC